MIGRGDLDPRFVSGNPGGGKRIAITGQAAPVGSRAISGPEVADAAMAERKQVLDCLARAGVVVDINRVQLFGLCFGLLVDQNRRHLDLRQPLRIRAADLGRGADDAVHSPAVEGLDDLHLALRLVVGNAEENVDPGGPGHILDPAHDPSHKGIGNGSDDQADGVGALSLQALSHLVGGVAHLLRQQLDALAHRGADQRAIMEGARYGRVGDPGLSSDILDGDGSTVHVVPFFCGHAGSAQCRRVHCSN